MITQFLKGHGMRGLHLSPGGQEKNFSNLVLERTRQVRSVLQTWRARKNSTLGVTGYCVRAKTAF